MVTFVMSDPVPKIKTARRRREVLQLRESGMTWEAIASTLRKKFGVDALPKGYDRRYAYKDMQRELDKLNEEVADKATHVRSMEVRRVNRMLRGIWTKALGDGNVDWNVQKEAIDRVVKLQERKAKLLGIDAPQGIEAHVDAGSPVVFEWPSIDDSGENADTDGG